MAQLLIRKIDLDVKENLRRRAKRHGVSMEEEARCPSCVRNCYHRKKNTASAQGSRRCFATSLIMTNRFRNCRDQPCGRRHSTNDHSGYQRPFRADDAGAQSPAGCVA